MFGWTTFILLAHLFTKTAMASYAFNRKCAEKELMLQYLARNEGLFMKKKMF